LFYVNDLPQLVREKVKPVLFADDTSFILSNSDPHLMISDVKEILGKIQNWFNLNRMLLNYKKTKVMQCFPNMNHQMLDSIEHNSNKVNVVNSIKFLGIIVDSSLTWREHADYINSKLNSLGYMVCSLRPVLGLKIIMQIYFSHVHSVLNDGIMFWGTSPHSRSIFINPEKNSKVYDESKTKGLL
jgi:hypothetical protein